LTGLFNFKILVHEPWVFAHIYQMDYHLCFSGSLFWSSMHIRSVSSDTKSMYVLNQCRPSLTNALHINCQLARLLAWSVLMDMWSNKQKKDS